MAISSCGPPSSLRAPAEPEKATAEAFQQSLEKVGITANPRPLPEGDYFSGTCGLPSYVVKNNIGMCVNGWGADWPDGYGFVVPIADSRSIREGGGNTNLSVRDANVDRMIDAAIVEPDEADRDRAWVAIDRAVMDTAYILPGVWNRFLLLRPERLTNVFVSHGFGGYDYTALGVKK